MESLEMFKLVLDVAAVPILLFAYKINRDVEDIKKSIAGNGAKIEKYEEANRAEHKHLLEHLHDLEKRNSVEHAQLGLR